MNPETVIAILAFLTGVTFIASFVAAMEDRASLSIICGSLAILFSSSMWHKVADLQHELAMERIVTGTHQAALVEFTVDLNGDTINRVYGLVEVPIAAQDSTPSPSAEP